MKSLSIKAFIVLWSFPAENPPCPNCNRLHSKYNSAENNVKNQKSVVPHLSEIRCAAFDELTANGELLRLIPGACKNGEQMLHDGFA